jgi:hypothetical protein
LKNTPDLGDGQPFMLHKVGESIEMEVLGEPKTEIVAVIRNQPVEPNVSIQILAFDQTGRRISVFPF